MLASYSVNSLNQAAWLVYINGIEVPVIGWTVNYGLWSFATANINMVPHPTLQRIGAEDRLQVAIFYLDLFWDLNQPTFRLLGEFEVIGMSYIGSGFSRQISLNCVSPLQIFSQLKFFYIASVDDAIRGALPGAKSDTTVGQIPKPMYPASLFLEGLTQPQTTGIDAFIKRPVDLVLNIFRSLLSDTESVQSPTTTTVTIPASATSIPGKNFFARWMKMNNFHMRWAALPEFEDDFTEAGCFPIIKAAQDVNTLTTVRDKFSESVGPAGSAWDLLQQVLGYMYMEIITIPAPSASTITPKTFVLPSLNAEIIPEGNIRTIPTYCVKPQSFFGLAPTCNVIFPSMLDSIQSSESYLTQPTRLYLNESYMSQVVKGPETSGSTNSMADDLLSTAYPPAVRARMKELASGTTGANNKNLLLYPEEFFKGPVTKRMSAPPWLILLQASLKKKTQVDGAIPIVGALGNIFDLYAQYEYFRARYADRNGALNMDFNPYPIPGFPCVVFDDRNVCFDTMGYIINVSHTAAATGTFKTAISTSFNRTIAECLGYEYQSELLESEEAKNNPGDPIVVPPVPAPEKTETKPEETKTPVKSDGTMTFVIGARGVTKVDKKGNKTTTITRPEERVSFKAFDAAGNPTAEAKTKYNEIMKPTGGGEMDLRLLQVFQLIADKWPGKAILINRSTVEGSESQHGRNNAVDFHVQGVPTPQVFRYVNAQFKSTKDYKLGLELAATDGSGAAGFIHADIRSKTWRSVDISGSGEKSKYLSRADVKNIAAGKLLPYEKVDSTGFTGAGKAGSPGIGDVGDNNTVTPPYQEPDFVAVDIFPPEPIPSIRKTLQVMSAARSFYGRLLYRGVARGRPPAYDWRDMMDLKIGDAEPIAVDEDYSLAELFSETDGSEAITFVPKKPFNALFTSNTKAMNYVARPACTLQEYIEIKNGAPLETLLKDKSKTAPVAGMSLSFYSGTKGSRFWGKIFNLTQGPGVNPGVNFTNVGPPPDYSAAATMEFLGTTAAQTGKNWAKILLRYRQIVRGESGFNTGQV